MKVDDTIRIKVLSALFEKGCIEPNYSKIARTSGLDVKTVRNSLFFLEKEGVIRNFMPLINARKLGFFRIHADVTRYDFSNERERDHIYKEIKKRNPNEYMVYKTDGPGLMNRFTIGIFRNTHEKYQLERKIENELHTQRWIRDKISIPLMEKVKYDSLSKTMVEILKKEKGL
jgi:DNA-binding Lrp family transcriptional regulator